MAGTAGSDCVDLRTATCGVIDAATFTPSSEVWSGSVTLDSSAMQNLCAETRDEAGNLNRVMVDVRLNSDMPQLAFESPSSGDCFNVDGTACARWI